MKLLRDILPQTVSYKIVGDDSVEVLRLELDSRKVEPRSLFFAIPGTTVDGHDFIDKAIELGAVAIVAERQTVSPDIPFVLVDDTAQAMGEIASAFYDYPSSKLKLVGFTGTNGKTTVATLLHELHQKLGHKAGLISTVENKIGTEVSPSTHTTPHAIAINKLLGDMVAAGCTHCFMEVSSHAIHQKRIAGLKYALAGFTNLSHDHLDYHKTFAAYRDAKKMLFDQLPADAIALINKDDKNGMVMLQNCKATKYTYALHSGSDFRARILEHDFRGMLLEIDQKEAWYQLVGKFNAYNVLSVYAATFLLGEDPDKIITALSSLSPVRGRFEYVSSPQGIIGIVDYAHTPDALKNVLETINGIRSKNEQLITVVGCGGNRDHEKRPVMAEVSAQLSDRVILTSDNPRTESPDAILADMQTGIPAQHFKKVLKITDREEAIKTAISIAEPNDIILIAGKGHETYQEIKGVKHPFDDKQVFTKNAALLQ